MNRRRTCAGMAGRHRRVTSSMTCTSLYPTSSMTYGHPGTVVMGRSVGQPRRLARGRDNAWIFYDNPAYQLNSQHGRRLSVSHLQLFTPKTFCCSGNPTDPSFNPPPTLKILWTLGQRVPAASSSCIMPGSSFH